MLRRSRDTLLAALLVAAILPYVLNLGVSSIWDANEAFYAQTPREMIETGDYVTPSFNFQLRMNKPVLSYWNVAASYHLFGISEWSERLPIAIGALVIIGTAFGLGRLLGGTFAGLLAALVLATSPRFVLLARRIIIDIHITMWTGLVLLLFALAETRPQRRRLYLCLMYVAAGFGVLTKGPVAVFLPAVVFFIYLASQKRLGDLRHMMLPTGALISLAIVVPWYYFLYREHGWEYIGVVHLRREPGAVCGSDRRTIARHAVLHPGDARGSLPVVADDSGRALVGDSRRAAGSGRAAARGVDCGDRGVLFALGYEGGFVHPPDRAGRSRADWRHACESRRQQACGVGRRSNGRAPAHHRIGGTVGIRCGASVLAGRRVAGWGGGPRWRARRPRLAVPPQGLRIGRDDRCERCRHRVVHRDLHPARFRALQARQAVLPTSFERARASARSSARTSSRCRAWSSICTGPSWRWCSPTIFARCSTRRSDVYFIMAEDEYNSIKDRLPVDTYVLARQQMFDLRPKNFLDGSELPQFVLVSNRD